MTIDPQHRKELLETWSEHRTSIRARLSEFRAVPPKRHIYELFFCIMTPQSSAAQCALVAEELERRNFLLTEFDPTSLLRSFQGGYVRFHNTKARRLVALRHREHDLRDLLSRKISDKELRDVLATEIDGLGMKEASHFLRNIGKTDLTIVDRHILRNMIRLGALDSWPSSIPRRRYLEIERKFEDLSHELGIPPDELDLLLWQRETGFLLK